MHDSLSPHPPHPADAARPALPAVVAATIVLLAGLVLLFFALTRRLNNYLQPAFLPLVAATALALVGLAGWTLWTLRHDSDGESPLRPTSALLLVPVLLAAVCAPNPLGSSLLNSHAVGGGRGSASALPAGGVRLRQPEALPADAAFAPLDDAAATPLTLEELARRVAVQPASALTGKQVTVVGFAAPAEEGWVLGRFKIFCCAADALPFQVALHALPQELEADQWYEVTGAVDASGGVPALNVSSLRPIPQPDTPYL